MLGESSPGSPRITVSFAQGVPSGSTSATVPGRAGDLDHHAAVLDPPSVPLGDRPRIPGAGTVVDSRAEDDLRPTIVAHRHHPGTQVRRAAVANPLGVAPMHDEVAKQRARELHRTSRQVPQVDLDAVRVGTDDARAGSHAHMV